MIQKIKISILKNISVLTFISLAFLSLLPLLASAQTQSSSSSSTPNCSEVIGGVDNLKELIDFGTCILKNSVVPLLTAIAVVFFMYGMITYFLNPGSVQKRDDAKKYMLWALVGLFVLYSVTGILQIFRNTFGVTGGFLPLLPESQ